uniref:beta-ketoacyl synthase N-terminal-like domain-containing protein n=1 Tax=Staphylococcus aureus TaxID=1280 RepID=UPI00351DEE64
MSQNRRVVITGMGALSPIGNDVKTTGENALKGVNGIDKSTRIDTEPYSVHLAGELKNFNIEDHIDKKETARMDEYVVLRFGWLYGPGTWYGKDGMIYN